MKLSEKLKDYTGKIRLGTLRFTADTFTAADEQWQLMDMQIKEYKQNTLLNEVNKLPNIEACRKFYKACGKDPSRYRPSAESLVRRIVKGNSLYRVNNVVDILNLVSLQTGISIGSYLMDKVVGSITLDTGNVGEPYQGIGRGDLNIHNLPLLRDGFGAFGSPTSDSERTMIVEGENDVLFVFFDFGLDPQLPDYLKHTINLLKQFANARKIDFDIVAL